jgi:hypothetical protein
VRAETWRLWLGVSFGALGCSDSEADSGKPALLDRASSDELVCSVGKEAQRYEQKIWTRYDVLGSGVDTVWSARIEAPFDFENPENDPAYAFSLAKLDAQGAFGASYEVAAGDPSQVSSLALAHAGSGGAVAAFWIEQDSLRMATFDGEGESSGAPKTVASGDELRDGYGLHLASADSGAIAASWCLSWGGSAFVLTTDRDGRSGEVRELSSEVIHEPVLVAAPGGEYAALWRRGTMTTEVVFARLDEDGSVIGAPAVLRRKNTPEYYSLGRGEVSLIALDDGYLAAWTESTPDEENSYVVIYVARLDADGELQREPVLLAQATPGVDQVEPTFLRWGDAVALLWARGSHIYVCGGCTPDHSVHMLLIDPDALTPKSNVVETAPPLAMLDHRSGGLLRRKVALLGMQDLVMLVGVQLHIGYEPAFAAFHCEPK